MEYRVSAIRTYYSMVDFNVQANSEKQAKTKAQSMIDENEVQFYGLEASDQPDYIMVWSEKVNDNN